MKTKDLVRYSIFLATAVVAGYIEHLIILPFLSGAKLGLANSIGLIILYIYGRDKYIIFGLLRVLISALLFTGFGTAFFISLGGNILASIITLLLTLNKKISIYGLSICGAIFHGIGQVIIVSIIYQTIAMINYSIILTITGIISGYLMALLSKTLLSKLPKFIINN